MKKFILKLALFTILVGTLVTVAGATSVDDFVFTPNGDGTVTVGNYSGTDTVVTVPSSFNGMPVTAMMRTFCNKSVTSVTIPDTVTDIGSSTFYSCAYLTKVTIPDGVTTIGFQAFAECCNLTSIELPDSLVSIGEKAFNEAGLKAVAIPDSVTELGEKCFSKCSSLTNVTIGDGVTTIGASAFWDCPHLTTVILGDNVATCSVYSFLDCDQLTTFTQDGHNTFLKDDCLVLDGTLLLCTGDAKDTGSFTVVSGVTSIGENAFNSMDYTTITLPSGITTIEKSAFIACTNLKEINLPDGLVTIGNGAFNKCIALTTLTIPDSVTTIDTSAFKGCTKLTKLTLGDGIESIGYGAFSGCSMLTALELPDSLTTIIDYAFTGMSFLSQIEIPDGVTSMGDYTLSSCTSLTKATIPASVSTMGYHVFVNCPALTSVYFGGTQEVWDSFRCDTGTATVYCAGLSTTVETTEEEIVEEETVEEETSISVDATATLSSTNLQVNGQAVAVQAYMINSNNYIKLRDLATMINNTGKNFEVTWNQDFGSIEMKSASSYTSVGGEMATDGAQSVSATLTASPIYLDGVLVELTAYNINDNNYFKLRDVMELFDVGVGYDNATSTASLDTSLGYTAD